MVKAVLFDVDGTLVDSIPYHNRALQQVFKKLGIRISRKKLHSVLRLPTQEIYFRIGVKGKSGVNFQAFNRMKREFYYKLIRNKSIVFPGLEETLLELKKGHRLAIVSNSSWKTVRKSVPRRILKLFNCIVTYDDVKRGKPYPEPIEKALKKLRIKPGQSVFVGDSYFDVIACNELNVKCFGVLTGISTRQELKSNGAWAVVKNVNEVRKFL